MRAAVVGALVVAGLVTLAVAGYVGRDRALAQSPAGGKAAAGSLIALSFEEEGDGPRQIVLIDADTRVMSTYHLDPATGELTLKSVRNVSWDLQMEEFNGNSPSPRDIRRLLERR